MKRYAMVIEKAKRNFGAYSPDVPGCVAVGDTIDEVRQLFKEALELHLQGTADDGEPIPEPVSVVEYVEVEEPRPVATRLPAPTPKGKRRARA